MFNYICFVYYKYIYNIQIVYINIPDQCACLEEEVILIFLNQLNGRGYEPSQRGLYKNYETTKGPSSIKLIDLPIVIELRFL